MQVKTVESRQKKIVLIWFNTGCNILLRWKCNSLKFCQSVLKLQWNNNISLPLTLQTPYPSLTKFFPHISLLEVMCNSSSSTEEHYLCFRYVYENHVWNCHILLVAFTLFMQKQDWIFGLYFKINVWSSLYVSILFYLSLILIYSPCVFIFLK